MKESSYVPQRAMQQALQGSNSVASSCIKEEGKKRKYQECYLLLEQFFESLLRFLFGVPLVHFFHKLWPFFFRCVITVGKGNVRAVLITVTLVCTSGELFLLLFINFTYIHTIHLIHTETFFSYFIHPSGSLLVLGHIIQRKIYSIYTKGVKKSIGFLSSVNT